MTAIEWTEATWNPIVGCSVISPGCTNCYAMKMANRLAANPATPHYAGTVQPSKGGPVWTGKLALAPDDTLTAPLRRRKPATYFVNSMGDLFHEDVPDAWIDRVFAVMALAQHHTFQVLTKRADRMRAYVTDREDREIGRAQDRQLIGPHPVPVLPNVWLGVSAEDQARADARIPDLLATPAAVRFVSAEPLLGPIKLAHMDVEDHPAAKGLSPIGAYFINALTGKNDDMGRPCPDVPRLDWVIVGGESGPGARPMHPDWARSLRDQCAAAGVPFFFKQWGAWGPDTGRLPDGRDPIMDGKGPCAVWHGGQWQHHENGYVAPLDEGDRQWVYRLGKRITGRLLDGREWNDKPEART